MSRGSSNLAGGEGCFWVKDQGKEEGGGGGGGGGGVLSEKWVRNPQRCITYTVCTCKKKKIYPKNKVILKNTKYKLKTTEEHI